MLTHSLTAQMDYSLYSPPLYLTLKFSALFSAFLIPYPLSSPLLSSLRVSLTLKTVPEI